jgi:hypothetical protein
MIPPELRGTRLETYQNSLPECNYWIVVRSIDNGNNLQPELSCLGDRDRKNYGVQKRGPEIFAGKRQTGMRPCSVSSDSHLAKRADFALRWEWLDDLLVCRGVPWNCISGSS